MSRHCARVLYDGDVKKAVFFDVGGTLLLANPLYWLKPALERWGVAADWRRLPQAGPAAFDYYNRHHLAARDLEGALQLWLRTDTIILEGLGVENAEEVARRLVDSWREPQIWPVAPHAREVLGELKKKGKKLLALSNWDALLPQVLEATGLAPYFDDVVVSALVGAAKPDERIFRQALRVAEVEPQEALHVGDEEEADGRGAEALGISFLLVDPLQPQRDLRRVLEVV